MLYFRQILVLFIALYTVRVVLTVLGVEDYGIYNVIAGLVALGSLLSATLASATQRFFSFALGEGDGEKLRRIFTVNLGLYAAVIILTLFLLESLGLWYVKEQLVVPEERLGAVLVLYQLSVASFLIGILKSPFVAILIAHEDMGTYAYISIFEALLALTVVVFLSVLPWDDLVTYGGLVLVATSITSLVYIFICFSRYQECSIKSLHWDTALLKEVVSFTGWSIFGHSTNLLRTHAVTILLNQSFNPTVVASRALAVTVANKVNMFAINFNTGLYPAIIKTYAEGDRPAMMSLVNSGSKATFFLLWVFALPLILEMETVLSLWLKEVPEYAVLFARLALVESLILSVSLPITTAARAPGRMMIYELSLGSIQIGIFIASWVVLNMGAPPFSVFVVAIVANVLMFFVRLILVRVMIGFDVWRFVQGVVIPIVMVTCVSSIASTSAYILLSKSVLTSFFSVLLSVTFSSLSMYFLALTQAEKKSLTSIILRKIPKLAEN
tara:strand:- start:33899 stop:35392 length:1494 start_codon:yes stop_codon:yes gene_type:complete